VGCWGASTLFRFVVFAQGKGGDSVGMYALAGQDIFALLRSPQYAHLHATVRSLPASCPARVSTGLVSELRIISPPLPPPLPPSLFQPPPVLTRIHFFSYVCPSFFEIYGGKLFDLLDGRKKLQALEDAHQNVCIAGLKEVDVDNVDLLLHLIDIGNSARSTGVYCVHVFT